jgi:uncharacterized protein (DUF2336 family)
MASAAQLLIADLETVLGQAPESWTSTALRRLTDLFLSGAEHYTSDQVAVFDDVMCRLIDKVGRPLLVELSAKLAPIDNAPVKVIGSLARHNDNSICGPILEKSKALPDLDMIEIADKARRDITPLIKMAGRAQLSEAITDVLLKRGNATIQRRIIDNTGARVSEAGFARLVTGVNGDKDLATAIAAREDLPAELRPWLAPVLGE